MVSTGDFVHHGDHLVCPQGKILRRGSYHRRSSTYQYMARQKGCQACPIKVTCLPPKKKRRLFNLTMYNPVYLIARERNQTAAYRREGRRRFTIAEGIFASLDRLSWARYRLRGLWKVDCEGYMAAFAHNVLKLVRRLSRGVGPPAPTSPAAAATADIGPQNTLTVAVRSNLMLYRHLTARLLASATTFLGPDDANRHFFNTAGCGYVDRQPSPTHATAKLYCPSEARPWPRRGSLCLRARYSFNIGAL